jgi:CHAT domain-containing protein
LHYFGHGAWRHGTAHLCLDDGWINASQFAAIAGDVPLMVLYACRSGAVGSDDLFTGIAPMLSAEGVAAVVAMQFTIGVEAALRFSAVFYKNLTQSESLQAAMTKARRALYAEHPMSWYVPVLYIRSRDFKPIMLFKR